MEAVPKPQKLTLEFLTKKPYATPSWASRLNPIPSKVFSLGHHKGNLPNLPKGTEVYPKHDDLSGMQLSGNKVRILEFLLALADCRGTREWVARCSHVVVFPENQYKGGKKSIGPCGLPDQAQHILAWPGPARQETNMVFKNEKLWYLCFTALLIYSEQQRFNVLLTGTSPISGSY
ncbi:unnamed protein product [Fraxinus pennsylvanica]|uniref:Uncharacterized protein n=1 Tax=Fraxinus pennsylvanica TaxID=56036 RepID=A0AAD1YTP1_9LAMI|nr:unnamed protein product [Fraxinus pennsylvanica]